MNDCGKYWAFAAYLPLGQVVEYWCQKTGYSDPACIEAKKAAVVAECMRDVIKYGRSDGKTFQDPAEDLAGRGILTIERESFDAWVMANFGTESPIPSADIGKRSETTYLNIIGGLLAHYDGKPGIAQRTLDEKFAAANRSLAAT